MNTTIRLTDLAPGSLKISVETHMTRIDDAESEVSQSYLTIDGTAAGFHWLAKHLQSMADHCEEEEGNGCANVVAPWDFANRPIEMDSWDSIEFICKPKSS